MVHNLRVSDTISKAPTSGTLYEDLKKAVLDRLESSEATRLQELLSKEELGNEKPSDLLRRMKRLLGDKYATFDNSILLHLFYQRLPPTIQGNLFSAKNKLALDELATLADDFMASVPVARPTIANLADQSATQALTELVSKLTLQHYRPRDDGKVRNTNPEAKPNHTKIKIKSKSKSKSNTKSKNKSKRLLEKDSNRQYPF
ncbi:chromosome alignment defect 1 [Oratosquilla oratoria]|uniref:chromosome alignment defect 1 n=1 Tax=Oratosquilla oratoria TaxID=337810 RepID=UPI003F75AE58